MSLPLDAELPALPRGVVLHWTGGRLRANSVDLAAYHYVVEVDATVKAGVPVRLNMRSLRAADHYGAHTGGWNSYRVGIAAAGMFDYVDPAHPGTEPLTEAQVDRMLELAGYFLRLGGLDPLNPLHLCTHREVWTIHGVRGTRNHQKKDIEYLPFAPDLAPAEVGDFLRERTAALMEEGRVVGPAPAREVQVIDLRPSVVAHQPALPVPERFERKPEPWWRRALEKVGL